MARNEHADNPSFDDRLSATPLADNENELPLCLRSRIGKNWRPWTPIREGAF